MEKNKRIFFCSYISLLRILDLCQMKMMPLVIWILIQKKEVIEPIDPVFSHTKQGRTRQYQLLHEVIAHWSSSTVQFILQNIATLGAIIALKLIKVYRKTK